MLLHVISYVWRFFICVLSLTWILHRQPSAGTTVVPVTWRSYSWSWRKGLWSGKPLSLIFHNTKTKWRLCWHTALLAWSRCTCWLLCFSMIVKLTLCEVLNSSSLSLGFWQTSEEGCPLSAALQAETSGESFFMVIGRSTSIHTG